MNLDETKNMIFSSKVTKPIHPPLTLSNIIEDVSCIARSLVIFPGVLIYLENSQKDF
jgi:hypothetical protein